MGNNTPHNDDYLKDDAVPICYFDRAIRNSVTDRATSSLPFTGVSRLTDIIEDAIRQPCPGCLNETMKFSTTTALGNQSKQQYGQRVTAFIAVNLACNECGQVSVLVVEIDADECHYLIEPVNEHGKQKLIDDLVFFGHEHLYGMYEYLEFKDYDAMLVTTWPEDVFVEREYFPKAFTALEHIFKNSAHSQKQGAAKKELAKAKADVREISSLIRSKNFGFANKARILFEWILPKLFKLECSGNAALGDILSRARKCHKCDKCDKCNKCGVPHFQPNIFNSILQKLQENNQETMNYKSMAGRLATSFKKHQFDSLTETEKFVLVERLHITCDKIRDHLNKHSHFSANPEHQSNGYFFRAVALMNFFFDLVTELLSHESEEYEENKAI